MTNISRHKTKTADYQLACEKLTVVIANLNRSNALCLIDELLTESERIMVVKRFAAIFMYAEHYSPYRISQTLGISQSTAQRIRDQYDSGSFDRLLQTLTRKEKSQFISLIEDLIMSQVSPRARTRLMNRAL